MITAIVPIMLKAISIIAGIATPRFTAVNTPAKIYNNAPVIRIDIAFGRNLIFPQFMNTTAKSKASPTSIPIEIIGIYFITPY